ncbi:Mrp/NBP35 family ATP-binding protein [Pararhodobacter zhoushanensis]|uniref:Iron-sulfur cluster carrier protein n=1 Tax=Pararhodobacter zhoushanensis TaxID=2479545 RepID=A0ABT3GYE1_9RHOB|nr:Mrp/NBP35 family ATP-binding protein [Pararhodobacter zhoushanensis]MCW1932579.1 Mrp/NBP35 family ATP-binding protein [Pararhodobacter zhoushanensis]
MSSSSAPTREEILAALKGVALPKGGDLVSADLIRALVVDGGAVRFVIEAETADEARALDPVRAEAERVVAALPGVARVSVAMTAHGPAPKQQAPKGEAPSLSIGRHPTPGPSVVPGVKRIIAVGSGKGGVGKSTVSANLAVAMAREGWRVGLVDADIYGPSQPRMMGVSKRPASPDGKTIIPPVAHGVRVISIGLMLPEDQALIWRGPMLMGALQQLMTQVAWGDLDALIIDMPPGTGDVQMTLCQKFDVTGAIVVSTPQDVALLDARRALNAFSTLKTPVIGLIENMSTFICPNCGHEEHIFGDGGVAREAEKTGIPFLGSLPLTLEVRLSGDGGVPVAATDSAVAESYRRIARGLMAQLA